MSSSSNEFDALCVQARSLIEGTSSSKEEAVIIEDDDVAARGGGGHDDVHPQQGDRRRTKLVDSADVKKALADERNQIVLAGMREWLGNEKLLGAARILFEDHTSVRMCARLLVRVLRMKMA